MASLRAKILEVMANMDKELSFIPTRSFVLVLRLLWRPVGIFIK
jgi:hypothetical protein